MLKLIVDDRETKIIPFFEDALKKENRIEIEVKRIQIGDYIIAKDDQILFAIERKSLKDLSASIKDGRKENINKLIKLRDETNCKIIYLIEGKARYAPNKKIARIPYKNLQSHLDHLIMRDNIAIIYSMSFQDSAHRLIEFMQNYLSIKSSGRGQTRQIEPADEVSGSGNAPVCPPEATTSTSGGMQMLTTPIQKTENEIIYSIWCCVPGITDKTAALFLAQDIHISDLILGNVTKEQIAEMRYDNGFVIGKRASKIISIQNNSQETLNKYYNMLACIKGITKKTAEIILKKFEFQQILKGEVSAEEIADVKKTENARVGSKAANLIIDFFVKK